MTIDEVSLSLGEHGGVATTRLLFWKHGSAIIGCCYDGPDCCSFSFVSPNELCLRFSPATMRPLSVQEAAELDDLYGEYFD